jgi:hypothetical protein
VPQDRVKGMRAAFQKTLRDPDLIAEAEQSKLNVSPVSGGQLRSMSWKVYQCPKTLRRNFGQCCHRLARTDHRQSNRISCEVPRSLPETS